MGGKLGSSDRIPREEAGRLMMGVVSQIGSLVERWELCGSYRRQKPECGDGDIVVLIPSDDVWSLAMKVLGCEPRTKAGSLRKGVIIVRDGFQIDIMRAKDDGEFGSMVLMATGSGEFNVMTRSVAKRMGMKLSQYGLHDRESGSLIAAGERPILEKIGLGWIEPPARFGWENLAMEV